MSWTTSCDQIRGLRRSSVYDAQSLFSFLIALVYLLDFRFPGVGTDIFWIRRHCVDVQLDIARHIEIPHFPSVFPTALSPQIKDKIG
eukprot:1157690-Pelagomonas_calceolata.AAC.5